MNFYQDFLLKTRSSILSQKNSRFIVKFAKFFVKNKSKIFGTRINHKFCKPKGNQKPLGKLKKTWNAHGTTHYFQFV